MSLRCLIVDKLHDSIGSLLAGIKVEYDYRPDITREEIKEVLADYEGLIIRSKTKVDEDLIKNSNLQFVARAGAGIDNIDEPVLKQYNIKIINAPEGNRDAVGEHSIGLILNLLHQQNHGHQQILTGIWDREGNRGAELGSLTVGIFGYGNTGSSLAKKLTGFGCRVIAYDKYLASLPDNNAEHVDLNTLFKETELLSLHIPLTDETNELANVQFFNEFNKQLIFINTSRGEIAPLHDLKLTLECGKIKLAGLDVLECERLDKMSNDQSLAFNWLKKSGRVLFTPHVAGWTRESYQRINAVLVEKIGAFIERG